MPLPLTGLVGHWPLRDDARDHSPGGLATKALGVELGPAPPGRSARAARFDGTRSFLEVADHPSLHFGRGDFTVSLHACTEAGNSDIVGDLVGKFDDGARKGFNFAVVSNAAATSAQSNYRNVHFGIDCARSDPDWQDCGRPGRANQVSALAVYDGDLYAGTFDAAPDGLGHVLRYLGEGRWLDLGAPDACNNVYSLAEHDGRLYCGSGFYRPWDSAMPRTPAPNETPGGRVFRVDGPDAFVDCGRPGDGDGITSLVSFRNRLYTGHQKSPGVYVYEGGREWRPAGLADRIIISLSVFRRRLYANANGTDVFRYEGDGNWASVGKLEASRQNYGMAVCRGALFVSTWPQGFVYRYLGGTDWEPVCGHHGIGYQKEIMAMNLYNGKLYCGTLPASDVFRYDGGQAWRFTGRLDPAPDVPIRRAWSMCVFQGRLYAGTLPGGLVKSYEAGKAATVDRSLPAGWHHLCAVRRAGELQVFVDGEPAARSTAFRPDDYDVTNECPLTIGFGTHTFFDGWLRDVTLHNRALEPAEIALLAKS